MSDDVQIHVITGDRYEVFSALSRAKHEGRLVSVTDAWLMPGDQFQVIAQLRTVAPPAGRWARIRPWLVPIGTVLAVLAVLATVVGLVWLLVLGVLALAAWVQAHLVLIVGVVVGLGLLWALLTGGGGCGGMHCGGCRG